MSDEAPKTISESVDKAVHTLLNAQDLSGKAGEIALVLLMRQIQYNMNILRSLRDLAKQHPDVAPSILETAASLEQMVNDGVAIIKKFGGEAVDAD